MSEFDPRFLERRVSVDPSLNITFSSGSPVDHSVYATNGTLNNGAVVTSGNRFVTLDGTDDYVTVADLSQNDLGSAFSICLWFQPSTPGSVSKNLIGKWNTTATRRSFLLQVDYTANNRFGFLVDSVGTGSGAGTCIYYSNSTAPPTSGWNFIAWTYDSSRSAGNRHKFYLNGAWRTLAVNTDNAVSPLVTPDPLWIAQAGNGAYWKGDMDDIKVFNRAISDTEVDILFAQGRP